MLEQIQEKLRDKFLELEEENEQFLPMNLDKVVRVKD